MKVIFLDFDGPMIPCRAWVLGRTGALLEKMDPIAVETILKAVEFGPAKIVVSSSWRTDEKNCKTALKENGISLSHLHDDWRTKNLVNHSMADRPQEIKEWLSRHMEVETWVVVDDAKMDIENLVHCSMYNGMSYDNQLELLHALNIDPHMTV